MAKAEFTLVSTGHSIGQEESHKEEKSLITFSKRRSYDCISKMVGPYFIFTVEDSSGDPSSQSRAINGTAPQITPIGIRHSVPRRKLIYLRGSRPTLDVVPLAQE